MIEDPMIQNDIQIGLMQKWKFFKRNMQKQFLELSGKRPKQFFEVFPNPSFGNFFDKMLEGLIELGFKEKNYSLLNWDKFVWCSQWLDWGFNGIGLESKLFSVLQTMQEQKGLHFDRDKKLDSTSNSDRIGYPSYLDTIRENMQISLSAYSVMILERQKDEIDENQGQISAYSLILTSHQVHRERFQIFTEAFLDQNTFCFFIRHLVTLNNLQLIIQNKQSISMAVSFCNKINKQLGNFKLVIDPPSGKIFFQTKSFINQASINSLKRKTLRQDCFYSQIMYCSLKKAQKYIDIILFLLGQISIFDLAKNKQLVIGFPFIGQCHQILERLNKNIIFIPFLDINPLQNNSNQETEQDLDYRFSTNWKSLKEKKKEHQKESIKRNQQKLSIAKSEILNNSLQFFTQNTQNTLKLFHPTNLYGNVDFSVKPFQFGEKSRNLQKTITDIDKKSFNHSKRILSFIQIVQVQGAFLGQDQRNAWKLIFQGGFGIIDVATVKYKNLSASYKEPDTGFSLLIKQQLVRKRDKISKKKKIQRQRTILQRLKYYSHPHIMSFYISFQSDYENCIFSDYTPNMSLDMYLRKNQFSVNFHQKISLINQAIEGLIFLHDKNIVHLDIKPGNMLINKRLVLMLSDFGEAFLIGENDPITHNHAYTIPYCAPEIFKQKAELTDKADVYAIGVCIIRLIFGQPFMETFLQKRFVKRLCKRDIMSLGVLEKYEKSIIYPIIKVMMMIAFRAVDEVSERRPQLMWMAEILAHCRDYILSLVY